MSLNLAMIIHENAKRHGDQPALIYHDQRWTFDDLENDINRMAHGLVELGIQRGDCVTVMLPNLPEFVISYFAIMKAGAVCVPINPLYKEREVEFLLQDSRSVAMVTCQSVFQEAKSGFEKASDCRHLLVVGYPEDSAIDRDVAIDFRAWMRRPVQPFPMVMTDADETAVLVYTSGTTGKPKGAMLTHFNLFYQAFVLPQIHWPAKQPGEVSLAILPLFHSFGQSCVMNARLARGAAVSLLPAYEPRQVLEVLQRHRVTHFSGVPTMYLQLLNHPERDAFDLSRLVECYSGGAPIPIDTLQRWKERYQLDILEGYGLTETSPVATFNFPGHPPIYGSCGEPIWGCQVKIVNAAGETLPPGQDGEVCIQGVNIMKGYFGNPEATAEVMKDGWFATGDQGHLDENGFLYIVGRLKDMILRGGFNVYPREIEELLYEHPAVHECAVYGVPDPEMGEEIQAAIYLKAGQQATAEDLKRFVKDRIAPYKYPRHVEIWPEPLPKGPSGKILKRELQRLHAERKT